MLFRSPCRTSDGRLLWVEASIGPVSAGDDEVLLAILRDVTEQRAKDAKLVEMRRFESMRLLAAGVAHDFNNLLGVIDGFTQFLIEDLPKDSQQHAYAERIVRATERGRSLSQRIMNLSRAQSAQKELIDLTAVIDDECDQVGELLSEQVGLRRVLSLQSLPILGAPDQISQLIQNLIMNARDAMPATGGEITITLGRVPPDRKSTRLNSSH